MVGLRQLMWWCDGLSMMTLAGGEATVVVVVMTMVGRKWWCRLMVVSGTCGR